MPALQVRDFPADLYEALRRQAESDHRSIAQQTVVAVEEHLAAQSAQTAHPAAKSVYATAGLPLANPAALREKRRRILATIESNPAFELPREASDESALVRSLRESHDQQVLGRVVEQAHDKEHR